MADSRPEAVRRTYAARANEIAEMVNRICQLRSDPEAFHQAKDDAARKARGLALALEADGL